MRPADERFIGSVKVRTWIANRLPCTPKPPTSKPARQQEAAARSGKGSTSRCKSSVMEREGQALRDLQTACTTTACDQHDFRSLQGSFVAFGAQPEYVITLADCCISRRGGHRGRPDLRLGPSRGHQPWPGGSWRRPRPACGRRASFLNIHAVPYAY